MPSRGSSGARDHPRYPLSPLRGQHSAFLKCSLTPAVQLSAALTIKPTQVPLCGLFGLTGWNHLWRKCPTLYPFIPQGSPLSRNPSAQTLLPTSSWRKLFPASQADPAPRYSSFPAPSASPCRPSALQARTSSILYFCIPRRSTVPDRRELSVC